MKATFIAVVLALLASAVAVEAQPTPFNPLINVSNTAGQRSDLAGVTADGATTYVVWHETTGATHEIRLRRSVNTGVSFIDGTNGRVVTAVDAAETVFAIRVSAAGSMVYVLYTSGVEPRLAKARLARSVDGGATFLAPVTLAEGPELGGSAFADLAVDGTGAVHVVLESRDAAEDVLHLSSIDQGLTFSAPSPLAASAGIASRRPRVAAVGSQIAVVWEEGADIAFVYSPDAGASFGAVRNLSASAANSTTPDIAIGNAIHVVWTEGDSVAIQTSLDGNLFTATQPVGVAPPGEQIGGVDVASSANTVHVSWITSDVDGAMSGPFYRRSTDGAVAFAAVQDLRLGGGGRPFGAPATVNSTVARIVWPYSPSGFEPDIDVHAAVEPNCGIKWKEAVSGNWNDATKWSPAVIPGVGSGVCITADGAPYTVTVPATQNAGVLTVGHSDSQQRPTVRITGVLIIGTSLVNSGVLSFASGGRLTADTDAIVNSERGLLTTEAGAASPARINGSLVNHGEVDLFSSLAIDGTLRAFTNYGPFTVRPGALISAGGGFVFNQNAGLLKVEGRMELTAEFSTAGDTMNFNGGDVDGTVIIQGHSRLNIGQGSVGRGTFQFERNVIFSVSNGGHLSGNVAPLQTVRLLGSIAGNTQGVAYAHVAAGVTNAGTIEMTATATNAGSATIDISGTMINTGRIVATRPGDTAVGRIEGALDNRGTLDLDDDVTFGSNGRLINTGTINVGAEASTVFGANYVFNQNGGVLRNGGRVEMSAEFSTAGDTFNFNDGTVEGDVIVQGHSRLNIGPGSVGAATFIFERNVAFGVSSGGHLSGTIAAAQTVRLRGTVGGTSHANVAAGFTNFGTLILESTAANAGGATLAMADSAGPFINRGSLIVNDIPAGKVLRGHLENRGAMTVLTPLSLQLANGTFNNFGNLTVGPAGKITLAANAAVTQHAGTMTLDGPIELATEFSTAPDLFTFAGGSIVGAAGVHLTSTSRLTIAASAAAGAGRFVYRVRGNTGGGTLSGNIGPQMTLRLQGNNVTAAGGLANAGTIVITQEAGNTTATLNVITGALVNTGTITVEPTAAGAPINAVVENHGRITINDTISLSRANATHVNDGEVQVAAGNIVTLTGNSTFRNPSPGRLTGGGTLTVANGSILAGVGAFAVNLNMSGRFRPGASPGVVNLTGNYTQGSTGRLEIEIVGFGAGAAFDQINISGVATLAGTLEVQVAPGSCVEGSYPFMSYASVAGDFLTKTGLTPGGGRTLTPSRGANVYALNVTGPPCNQAPVANADAYQTNQGTALSVAAPGVLANDTDAQNDALTAVLEQGPANGTLILNANGSFVYTPNAAFAGTDSFTYSASDGVAQSGAVAVTISVIGETVPPVTTATLSQAPNANGWHRQAVIVMLNSDDGANGSGVQHIQVAVNGAPPQVVEGATASVQLADEGVHTIRYFAVDRAGNAEVEQAVIVRIDMTPPAASGDRTPANEHGWNNTDVVVRFNADDALSGLDGAAMVEVIRSEEGADQSAAATFTDLAGNSATFTVAGIHIDKTPPAVTGARQTAANQFGWNNGPVAVSFTATDALSGIAGESIANVSVDGEGANQSAIGQFADLAGNSASSSVGGINIDLTPPAISGAPDREPNANGWYNADVTITLTCSDALSGVETCDPLTAVIGEEGVNLSRQGTATDRAGNTAATTVGNINIDKTAPAISGAPDRAPNQHAWYNADVLITFTCSDALSGVETCDPLTAVIGEEGLNLSRQGVVTDLAGNTAQATVGNISIDKTAPAITGAPDRAPNPDGFYTAPVEITFTCSDGLSGVASCEPASAVISEEGEQLSRTGVATDRAGNTAQATVGNITIDLPDAPLVCSASASTQSLWPPNHRLVPVTTTVTVTGAVGAVTSTLLRTTSSEPDQGAGAGDTANDIQGFLLGTPDTSGLLRAERAGNAGARLYSLVYEAVDASGRTATCTATVTVPHDQGGGKK